MRTNVDFVLFDPKMCVYYTSCKRKGKELWWSGY